MTDYDSPWKEALDEYFFPFLEFCFPKVFAEIDTSEPALARETELQQIAVDSETGRRSVDKLVEVRLRSGKRRWIMIHVEVQSQRRKRFKQRMFVYFYRILDKFERRVVSLAVLGDTSSAWRPSRFRMKTLGCQVDFRFPIVKLLDFADDIPALERSTNPFAAIVLAHIISQQTTNDPQSRCDWKLRVLRPLYERGWHADDVRRIFRVIDWMMELPDDLGLKFHRELNAWEQEKKMPYVTSIERIGIEKGIEQGIERGIEEGIERGRITLLQELLGETVLSASELAAMSGEARHDLLKQLQQRMAHQSTKNNASDEKLGQ